MHRGRRRRLGCIAGGEVQLKTTDQQVNELCEPLQILFSKFRYYTEYSHFVADHTTRGGS